MSEIKSFNIFQTARVVAVIYAIIASVAALFVALVLILHGHPGRAILAILLMPVLYGLGSFVGVSIFCWVYNEVASRLGGVAFELAPRSQN